MPVLTLRHEIHCDEDTYWDKCVFDPEYNRRLFFDELKFKSFEVVEQKEVGDKILRKVKAEPQTGNLPGPIKKAIGDSFGYTEDATFARKAKVFTFKTTPGGFPDKVKIHGTMRCERLGAEGDKKVTRITEVHVDVKVFMIGGLIEDRIVADLKSSYAKAADFTNAWVKEKGY